MDLTLLRNDLVVAIVVVSGSGIAGSTQADRASEIPYAGKWKLNIVKSDFGERTLAFDETRSGEMQMTYARQSYTFQVDGKDYPAILGLTAAWKQIDPNTWEAVYKKDGTPWATDTTRLSADGKRLTIDNKGVKPTGGTIDHTTVYERVSGSSGLVGTWKTKNAPASGAGVLDLLPSGTDGMTVRVPDFGSCDAKFDGKDYPVLGSTVPPGMTWAIQKTGPRSFDWTTKLNGKPLSQISFTVSGDGKTLTGTGGPVAVSEKTRVVYDRVEL